MESRTQRTLLSVACCIWIGCGGGNDGDVKASRTTPCDPFAAHMLPIELTELLGAGKDSKGTIYAADDGGDDGSRVFVSNGKQLVRQRVAGSGVIGGQGSKNVHVFNVTDHDPPFVLQIDGTYPDSARMGVVIGMLTDRKTFEIGQDGEELSIVPESKVRALDLRNLPGDVVLEYADRLKDGRLLVVTRPEDDWAYEDFRVFLGTKSDLVERRLIGASRGNDTYIMFDLEGSEVEAFFPFAFTADGGSMPDTPTLTIAGDVQDLVPLDGRPSGAHYQCLEGAK